DRARALPRAGPGARVVLSLLGSRLQPGAGGEDPLRRHPRPCLVRRRPRPAGGQSLHLDDAGAPGGGTMVGGLALERLGRGAPALRPLLLPPRAPSSKLGLSLRA